MFELALRSAIPIISVSTTDLVHARMVIEHYAGSNFVTTWSSAAMGLKKSTVPDAAYFVHFGNVEEAKLSPALYIALRKKGQSLILVNPDMPVPYAFDAGELPVPYDIVKNLLASVLEGNGLDECMKAVSGLTLKNVWEVAQLASTEFGEVSAPNLLKIRTRMTGALQGLSAVPADPDFYAAPTALVDWLKLNNTFFSVEADPHLVPRGILLDGPAGVGKTQGAKFVAQRLKVPLYRLDLSSSLGRYVGESEANLRRALSTIDHEAPCVLLIDEIEKLFDKIDDSGVTSRLLAQLLWWLQEHTSLVLTVMTTNKMTALPPELFRPGRIDTTLTLAPMAAKEAEHFALDLLTHYNYQLLITNSKARSEFLKHFSNLKKKYTGAEVTQAVKDFIKHHLTK